MTRPQRAHRRSHPGIRAIAVLAVAVCLVGVAWTRPLSAQDAHPPGRVVSMNLCTDQLAMLLAGPEQLHSVSHYALKKDSSAMAGEAAGYRINHGGAEEIFLMQPDLVLAGTFSARSTVAILRELGFRVEEFAPASSFEDIRANIARMGRVLHRPDSARRLLAEFDAAVARLPADARTTLSAAFYDANSYTFGSGTLFDQIITAAGLQNLPAELGVAGTGQLSLERLAVGRPDIVITGHRRSRAPALADQILDHPVLQRLRRTARHVVIDHKLTACGTPYTLEAVRRLVAERHKLRRSQAQTVVEP